MPRDLGELLVPSGGWIVVADHDAASKVERGLGSIAGSDASAIEATLTVHIDPDSTGFDDVDARPATLLIERTNKPY